MEQGWVFKEAEEGRGALHLSVLYRVHSSTIPRSPQPVASTADLLVCTKSLILDIRSNRKKMFHKKWTVWGRIPLKLTPLVSVTLWRLLCALGTVLNKFDKDNNRNYTSKSSIIGNNNRIERSSTSSLITDRCTMTIVHNCLSRQALPSCAPPSLLLRVLTVHGYPVLLNPRLKSSSCPEKTHMNKKKPPRLA